VTAGEQAGEPDTGSGERYEQLRRRVLDGELGGVRLGLAVLQRQGVAAWMAAWSDLPVAPSDQSPPGGATADALVAVLASMALACAGVG